MQKIIKKVEVFGKNTKRVKKMNAVTKFVIVLFWKYTKLRLTIKQKHTEMLMVITARINFLKAEKKNGPKIKNMQDPKERKNK